MGEPLLRRATTDDTSFLVEAICEAEKSGGDRLSYGAIFGLSEEAFRSLLVPMLLENLGGQELCVSAFLLAEEEGRPLAAVASWVEGSEGMSSALLKASLLHEGLGRERLVAARPHFRLLAELVIPRQEGAVQLESVYVRPEARGRGLAGRLIEAQIARFASAAEAGRAQVILAANNAAARRAYERCGFVVTEERWSESPEVLELVPCAGKLLMERKVEAERE